MRGRRRELASMARGLQNLPSDPALPRGIFPSRGESWPHMGPVITTASFSLPSCTIDVSFWGVLLSVTKLVPLRNACEKQKKFHEQDVNKS